MKPLKNMKIRTKDRIHCELVVQLLTSLGYTSWRGNTGTNGDAGAIYAQWSSGVYILADNNERLDDFFRSHEYCEVKLGDLQAMLAEPDETSEDNSIPEFCIDHTINTYISQIQKRLADTNLSVSIYADEIRVANTDNDDEASVKNWDGVLGIIKAKQAYLNVFKGD